MPAYDTVYVVMVADKPALGFWRKKDAEKCVRAFVKYDKSSKSILSIEEMGMEDPAIYISRMCEEHRLSRRKLDRIDIMSSIGAGIKSLAEIGMLSFMKYVDMFFKDELKVLYKTEGKPKEICCGNLTELKEDMKATWLTIS